ncbi:MAG: hypothetical protein F6K37_20635 [Moorea sp. SIO4E2]|uniref:hypothetical protein n=1 Tax=Moorena sp. SIO4E2 TaxID=2607826 RepID=UPI0013BE1654|nr:hypothetical protein [Moorena sp. SIO4E2]NEQ08267.1 hypothetical protein [Moorena sp. SIO4E2]
MAMGVIVFLNSRSDFSPSPPFPHLQNSSPDSRFPIPDSQFPIPDSRFPIPYTTTSPFLTESD